MRSSFELGLQNLLYILPLYHISIQTATFHMCNSQMWQMAVVLDSTAVDFNEGDFWIQKDLGLNAYFIIYFLCDLEQVTVLQSCHET